VFSWRNSWNTFLAFNGRIVGESIQLEVQNTHLNSTMLRAGARKVIYISSLFGTDHCETLKKLAIANILYLNRDQDDNIHLFHKINISRNALSHMLTYRLHHTMMNE